MHTITLNGREYSLHFSVNSLCCLEEKMEKGLYTLMKTNLSCLRGLLWCGLMEEEKGITLEDAGSLLESHLRAGGSLMAVSHALSRALEDAGFFPHPGMEEKRPPSAAAM